MPASTEKSTSTFVFINRAADAGPGDALKKRVDAIFQNAVRQPFVKDRITGPIQIIHPNENAASLIANLGIQAPEGPLIISILPAKTTEAFREILSHPSISRDLAAAEEEFGFKSSDSVFATERVVYQSTASLDNSGVWAAGIFNSPADPAGMQAMRQKVEALANTAKEFPIFKRHMLNGMMFYPTPQHDGMEQHLSELGYPSARPQLVWLFQLSGPAAIQSIIEDQTFQDFFTQLPKEILDGANVFTADVSHF
ncbi:unnamed protein product [Mycena citricolor]|uniref:Uncharacterized protein n=1 Tax=Mycena citricolor TaxID=2018698 RepID=A0AAD2GZH0_9AGAR|nr:unnamed protein product [Mycena citricolor]